MKIDLAISGETKLTGLVGGSGITSSFSPRMHTASFAEVGVDAVYLSFPIAPEMLGEVVQGLQDIAVGYNVTMPYKTYICKYLDGLSPAARLMGAVNTVEIKDGKSYGHNTDGAGFSENLRVNGFNPSGKKVTIVGAGGAGSAVSTQLALDGAASILISRMSSGRKPLDALTVWRKRPGRVFPWKILMIGLLWHPPLRIPTCLLMRLVLVLAT